MIMSSADVDIQIRNRNSRLPNLTIYQNLQASKCHLQCKKKKQKTKCIIV